jgi:hypothetical protein
MPDSYEERYQWIPQMILAVPAGLALALGAVVMSVQVVLTTAAAVPPADLTTWLAAGLLLLMMLGVGGFIGVMALGRLLAYRSRRIMLRVDSTGVTLGRPPLPFGHAVHVPWRDVESFVLFEQHGSRQGLATITEAFVGLRLTPDAVRPPGVPAPRSVGRLLMRLNSGPLRRPKIDVYRSMRGSELDVKQLRIVVRRYGQGNEVWVDTRRSAADVAVNRPRPDASWMRERRIWTGPPAGTWQLPSSGHGRRGGRSKSGSRRGRRHR